MVYARGDSQEGSLLSHGSPCDPLTRDHHYTPQETPKTTEDKEETIQKLEVRMKYE